MYLYQAMSVKYKDLGCPTLGDAINKGSTVSLQEIWSVI